MSERQSISFGPETFKTPPRFKSTWHKMRELVILSLNVIYIKDTLQMCERMNAKLEYMNFSKGSIAVIESNLHRRKHELNKRIKELLENILNSKRYSPNEEPMYAFSIDKDHASLTKKQLEKGYALYTNVRDRTYALNLRNGSVLIIVDPERNVLDPNLQSLEYTAKNEGSVYKYFEIDTTDPLKNELRY